MNDVITNESKSEPKTSKSKPSIKQTVAALMGELERSDPGTIAALRRADPASPPMEFFRLSVKILDNVLPEEGPLRSRVETQWLTVVSSMARGLGLLGRVDLGRAMAEAKIAERRLLKLLEACNEQLADMVRTIVHQLVQKGHVFDPVDIADLVLSDGTKWEKETRRRIARNYYRHQTN